MQFTNIPCPKILSLHFSDGFSAVHWVHKRNETEASGFILMLRSDHLRKREVEGMKAESRNRCQQKHTKEENREKRVFKKRRNELESQKYILVIILILLGS